MTQNGFAVFGIVANRYAAEGVVADLHRIGFAPTSISVLLSDNGMLRDLVIEKGNKGSEGAVTGGAAGGAIGGTLGVLLGIGALAIPGFGPLIAAGPVLSALSGVALGAAAGSMTGGLIGLGLPEIRAKAYEGKVVSGSVLVAVHAEDSSQIETAERTLALAGVEDICWTGEASLPASDRKVAELHRA